VHRAPAVLESCDSAIAERRRTYLACRRYLWAQERDSCCWTVFSLSCFWNSRHLFNLIGFKGLLSRFARFYRKLINRKHQWGNNSVSPKNYFHPSRTQSQANRRWRRRDQEHETTASKCHSSFLLLTTEAISSTRGNLEHDVFAHAVICDVLVDVVSK